MLHLASTKFAHTAFSVTFNDGNPQTGQSCNTSGRFLFGIADKSTKYLSLSHLRCITSLCRVGWSVFPGVCHQSTTFL